MAELAHTMVAMTLTGSRRWTPSTADGFWQSGIASIKGRVPLRKVLVAVRVA